MSVVESHKNYNPRLRVFYYFMVAVCLVLTGGLAKHQLLENVEYREKEIQQNQRRVLIPGPRGNIFDREGRLLVGNTPRFSAIIYLAELRQEFRREYITLVRERREAGTPISGRAAVLEARANVVQRYLDEINAATGRREMINPTELDRHFRQRLLLPFQLVNDLDHDEFASILEQIPRDSKIQLHSVPVRYYPHGAVAAHVLGYVSSTRELPNEDLPGEQLMTFNIQGSVGRAGLERTFEEHLQGKTGSEIWIVDPSGFRYGQPVERRLPVKGNDLVTSLDLDIQRMAERELDGRTGAVIAVDVHTGEILALASKPDYDLNSLTPFIPQTVFQQIEAEGGWLNRAVQGLYPPGSTFKIISGIAGMRSGAVTPSTTSYCGGSYRVGGRNFPCHSRGGHGLVDLAGALRVSCNVYFYEHGLTTGIESIAAEARRFGLHQRTGIELPFEPGRMVVPDDAWKRRTQNDRWYPGDTANVSIGQGFLLVTPLQMAQFTASLARQETTTQLTLLRRTPGLDPLQRTDNIGLTAAEMAAVVNGMEQAVLNGTARFARLPDVRVAGKTGTAQIRIRGGTLHLAWFAGFAPVEDPRIAVVVMVEGTDINDNYAGGTTAAPIAREVMKVYLDKQRTAHGPDFASTGRQAR
jgi:penicillin-binding protein 2